MNFTVKIEQTFHEARRMKYIAVSDSFIEKDCDSLSYVRKVEQPYGWIMESGTPPCDHLDAIVMTDRDLRLGDTIGVRVIGVFCRNDGDHKLVTVPLERTENDFYELSREEQDDMHRLYPFEDVGEGWFGREKAEEIVKSFLAKKKKKTIITVQHTESEHHVNGMIGAQGNWNLTARGREQAQAIGEWLKQRIGDTEFYMYVSDMNRTMQTAEEMNRAMGLTPEVRADLREVNAGAGNGQSREWYRAHKHPEGEYDPDYKPFDDAESDRELWARIYPFYQEIVSNDKENIIIVSHGTTLSFLQSMLMGYTFEDIKHFRFNGCGGSVSKFNLDLTGKVTASFINQCFV